MQVDILKEETFVVDYQCMAHEEMKRKGIKTLKGLVPDELANKFFQEDDITVREMVRVFTALGTTVCLIK